MVAYASPVEYVPGEVIVRLKKTASVSSYAGISDVKHSEFKVMKVDKNKDIYAAINELALNPDVEFAEPNYIFHISTTPNIKLWALKNTGQAISHTPGVTGEWIYPSDTSTSGTSGDDIDAVSAWSIFNDCSSIIVAIIDTGVKYDHSDFIGNMWDGLPTYPNHGYNFIANEDHNNPTTSNNPMDTCGHGTHVAGIIGASGTVSGVCGNVKLMAVKSFGSDGAASSATIVSGIGFAIDNGANIINASFNIYSYSAALSTEIAAAKSAGILFVAAAGNGLNDDGNGYNVDTGTQTYPCGFTQDNVLCVAALDQNFDLASFSNYGATSVDVAAPGTNIYSTWCTSPTCLNSTGCGCGGGNHGICAAASPYAIENGTSMATPYAAGLAALVWANNPSFTYLDVKNAVMYGGTAVSSMSGKSVSGNVINAVSALAYINSPTGLAAKVQ
jgi:subtilisin family serine protease